MLRKIEGAEAPMAVLKAKKLKVKASAPAKVKKAKAPKAKVSVDQLPLDLTHQFGRPSGLSFADINENGKVDYMDSEYRLWYAAAKKAQDDLVAMIQKRGKYPSTSHEGGDVVLFGGSDVSPRAIRLVNHVEETWRPQVEGITLKRRIMGLGVPYRTLKFRMLEQPKDYLTVHVVGLCDGKYALITHSDALEMIGALDNKSHVYTLHLGAEEIEELTSNAYQALSEI